MHLRIFVVSLAAVVLTAVAFGQPGNIPPALNPGVLTDAFQVHYLANLNIGDGVVNITNTGALGADPFGPLSGTTGRICVNV